MRDAPPAAQARHGASMGDVPAGPTPTPPRGLPSWALPPTTHGDTPSQASVLSPPRHAYEALMAPGPGSFTTASETGATPPPAQLPPPQSPQPQQQQQRPPGSVPLQPHLATPLSEASSVLSSGASSSACSPAHPHPGHHQGYPAHALQYPGLSPTPSGGAGVRSGYTSPGGGSLLASSGYTGYTGLSAAPSGATNTPGATAAAAGGAGAGGASAQVWPFAPGGLFPPGGPTSPASQSVAFQDPGSPRAQQELLAKEAALRQMEEELERKARALTDWEEKLATQQRSSLDGPAQAGTGDLASPVREPDAAGSLFASSFLGVAVLALTLCWLLLRPTNTTPSSAEGGAAAGPRRLEGQQPAIRRQRNHIRGQRGQPRR